MDDLKRSLFCCILLSIQIIGQEGYIDMNNVNDIFKIKDLKIGQAESKEGITGVTVLFFPKGAIGGVDVRGSAPGTRETDLLNPVNLVDKVHAIVLAGGSAFGLDAMSGVVKYLEENGIGFDTGDAKVPIVTGAVLYDLEIGNSKIRPDAAMGYEACENANNKNFELGNHGAGTGAVIGKLKGLDFAMKSGIGSYTLTFENGLVVSAIVAVNALGDVYENGKPVAGLLNETKSGLCETKDEIIKGYKPKIFKGTNTTLGVIVTNAKLTKTEATKISQVAHDGYARAINPVHTMYDGDIIFTTATGEIELNSVNDQIFLGVAAAEAMEKAIISAVKNAEAIAGLKTYSDL